MSGWLWKLSRGETVIQSLGCLSLISSVTLKGFRESGGCMCPSPISGPLCRGLAAFELDCADRTCLWSESRRKSGAAGSAL